MVVDLYKESQNDTGRQMKLHSKQKLIFDVQFLVTFKKILKSDQWNTRLIGNHNLFFITSSCHKLEFWKNYGKTANIFWKLLKPCNSRK